MTQASADRAALVFADALRRLRVERGLSKKQLAKLMNFDPSYISHVEAGRHRPTEDVARRADTALGAGGTLWQLFREYDDARTAAGTARPRGVGRVPEQRSGAPTGLIVERELAHLTYRDGFYHCLVRRALFNAGAEPVTRYLARVSVDRYPAEPDRSNRHYRAHPLTWSELDLSARSGGEPMVVRPKSDRDSFKEVWLLFENADGRFPLYPGQRATIEYSYMVGEDKWGSWFQRAVRLPTQRLTVRLDFPATLDPVVWGVETSLTAAASPLRTPVTMDYEGDRMVFEWATEDPPLNARYRLEWRFRARDAVGAVGAVDAAALREQELRLGDRMAAIGIVQRGAPVLTTPARQFDLPAQRVLAEEVVSKLSETLDRVEAVHHFAKGVGLAAPQVGIGWAAAVVRPPAGPRPIVLLNPRVVAHSTDKDEKYEGCLSFFDVRGAVPRPLTLDVRHHQPSGEQVVTRFERAVARLVSHEIDHLEGVLYPERMPATAPLVPLEEYRELGHTWRY
jgi:peptide deformylase